MAYIYGDDGGTLGDGRRRKGTNAGGWNPVESGGVTGPYTPTLDPTPGPQTPNVPNVPNNPTPGPQPPAPNFGWLSTGFDQGKVKDPNHHTFKYDFARTVAPFDPRKGFTSDVLSALNGLGYADFYSPGGDQLGIRGVTDKGRAAGMDPRDFLGDFIEAFDSQSDATKWGFDWMDDATQSMGAGSIMGPDPGPWVSATGGGSSGVDLSWLGDLLKTFAPSPQQTPAPAAPPVVLTVPGVQPSASYSQPSPTFGGGYVSPGYTPSGNQPVDATSLLSMVLPELLKDPNAMQNPLVQQIMRLVQGS
jgi:hypothetical protein